MAILEINGQEYEAKGSFAFARKADDLLGTIAEKSKTGKQEGGLNNLLGELIDGAKDLDALMHFWQCALAHEKKIKLTDIESALEKRIEEEGTLELIKEAYAVIDESGFFKRAVEKFWSNVDIMSKIESDDEKENQQYQLAIEMMTKAKAELTSTK
ncbi:tail assembly chaperone [Lysinibacillus sp. SGAir0095]|uniref:tail assembly chaperone n=1 Tax=Lysinibacillus sp. SGAir0095 TaxID=2070463 RepID=UPI00143E089A|nr:tail assembly chaperone [Lysinibacillus sp. SGAir0095]